MTKKQVPQIKIEGLPHLTMYFVLKTEQGLVAKMIDLDSAVSKDFSKKLKTSIYDMFAKDSFALGSLSTADERNYDAIIYDLELVPPLDILNGLIADPQKEIYSHRTDHELTIDGYIFVLSNDKLRISMYKKHYNMDSLSRDSALFFGRDDSRFVSVQEDEVYRITPTIDIIVIDGITYVFNFKVLEQNLKVHDIIKKQANNYVDEIDQLGFLENAQFIKDQIQIDTSFARKVLKVNKESPVLKLPFKDIRKFVEQHEVLKDKLKLNKRGTKFQLDTKLSAKMFMKLMDDDFLKSELTQRLYDSIVKDRLEEEKQIIQTGKGRKK